MSKLAARIRTGVTLALAAFGLLWLHRFFPGGGLSLGVMAALAALSIWELDRMGSFRGRKLGTRLHFASLVCAALLGALIYRGESPGAVQGLLLLYACALLCSFSWPPATREVLPAALWLLPPLYSVVLVDHEFGIQGLTVLVVLAKIGDNAGYFVGRALGKRHPFPNVSPGKTLAGCVASLLVGAIGGALLLPLTLSERTPAQAALGALLGGLINIAAQAGDLSESWVKRRAGVKDSSRLLGPSGGVLDVIDSLLLAAPTALVFWSWAYGGRSIA